MLAVINGIGVSLPALVVPSTAHLKISCIGTADHCSQPRTLFHSLILPLTLVTVLAASVLVTACLGFLESFLFASFLPLLQILETFFSGEPIARPRCVGSSRP